MGSLSSSEEHDSDRKEESEDPVSGGTPSNKAMEKICMQETAPAGKVVKKRREEGKRKKKKTISRQKINKIKSRVSFKE
jgi:hypothetical protein